MTSTPDPVPDTLRRGDVVWAVPDPSVGREQSGRRPAVVIAGDAYLANVARLAVVVPVTSVDRGWPNHVLLRGDEVGLSGASFAMTEQIKTIDRRRIEKVAGHIDEATRQQIDRWLLDFLDLQP